jgi:hypothetical protein
VVYADGKVSEFGTTWCAADLLAVSSRDRIDLKHRTARVLGGLTRARRRLAHAARAASRAGLLDPPT